MEIKTIGMIIPILLAIVALGEGIAGNWLVGGIHWIAAGLFYIASIIAK